MAAKKPKAPKKFKQARKAAVADAKGAFASGKTKAVRRDPMAKVSAEDKAVLSEVKKEAKAGYITDDKGNKVFSKPTETAQERFARDRREAKAAVDRMYEKEDAASKATKTKPTVGGTAGTTAKPKPGLAAQIKKDVAKVKANKAAASKPATKKPSVTKSMTRAEKSAANKAAWAKMTPAERKNWAATRGTAAATAAKPTTTKPAVTTPKVKTNVAAKGELKTAAEVDKYKAAVAQGKSKGEAVRIAKGGSANLPAVVAKKGAGTVATTGAKSAGKKLTAGAILKGIGKGAWKATGGKVGLAVTAAGLAAGPIQRKLSEGTEGRTTWDLMNSGKLRPAPKTTADYGRTVPGGAKGKAAAAAAGAAAGAAAMKQRSNQPRITGQGKYKGRNVPTINSGGSTTVYKVETGDTLSGIAKKAGVTLSELMEVNKKIKDPRKIYRNTTVRIPSKGKTPTPMYTGPVPYVPGSKAAKAYEASRKK
jgi:LysM repeat protein